MRFFSTFTISSMISSYSYAAFVVKFASTFSWIFISIGVKKKRLQHTCVKGNLRSEIFAQNARLREMTSVSLRKCLFTQISVCANVFLRKCLVAQMSFHANICFRRCIFAQMSLFANLLLRKGLIGNESLRKCRTLSDSFINNLNRPGPGTVNNIASSIAGSQSSWNTPKRNLRRCLQLCRRCFYCRRGWG